MSNKIVLALLLLAASAGNAARAQGIVSEGILGNSGEAGSTLVRSAPREATGIGVVSDRFGSLWDRAGLDILARYAPDGRMLAQYAIPRGSAGAGGNDALSLVGDLLVMKLGDGLYTLPVTAPEGTSPTSLNMKASRISFNHHNGWLVALNGQELFRFNPATGGKEPLATLENAPNGVEVGPDGSVFTMTRGMVQNMGALGDSWPRKVPGERLQWLDGAWWSHGYHSTIFRSNESFALSPGVVLGGASGSFIGHLPENVEINNGRGMALLRPNLYAVSGWSGILHLLAWDEAAQRLEIVRRIGSVPTCTGIGLDSAGRVWWNAGMWNWNDRPDAPLKYGMSADATTQVVTLPSDIVVTAGERHGKAALFRGRLDKELATNFVTPAWDRKVRYGAATTYTVKNERFLLLLTRDGRGRLLSITNDGGLRRDEGEVTLQTVTPVKQWTSLAMKNNETLLGAGDGFLVEFNRKGEQWVESGRWNAWDDQDIRGAAPLETQSPTFGPQIWVTADAGRIWVSDRDHHRVLCFDANSREWLGVFGGGEGDDWNHLQNPQLLVAQGARAVVFDSGNQRLVKLVLPE